jgi:hypothetical protein
VSDRPLSPDDAPTPVLLAVTVYGEVGASELTGVESHVSSALPPPVVAHILRRLAASVESRTPDAIALGVEEL